MKIKTRELSGPALDWAVAKCLWPEHTDRYPAWWFRDHPDGCYLWEALDGGDSSVSAFSPQTNWSQGGPIIERECICTYASGACSIAPKNPDYWVAEILDTAEMITQYGPSPLIAAMRCYVASKLGDEVEIPAELI